MKKYGKVLTCLSVAAALGLSMGTASAMTVTLPHVNSPIAGGSLAMAATYTGGDLTVGYQCNVTYNPAQVTVTSVTGAGGTGLCSNPTPGTIVLLDGTPNNTPMGASGTTCNIVFNVLPGTAGTVIPLNVGSCVFSDAAGKPLVGNPVSGSITLVAVGPPTITFTTTAIALPAGAFGATVSATLPASIASGGGSVPTNTASYSCTATAGFTVTPANGGPFANGATLPAITVGTTLTGAAQNGTVNCTATNTAGSNVPFAIPVSAPAGTQTRPNLASTPASGSTINLPTGMPGSVVSSSITVTPTGGVGALPATLTCSAAAPISVTPTTQLSFLPGSAAQSVSVRCTLLEDVAQNGTVTCTGTAGAGAVNWTYPVVCPAGTNTPAIVPATSAWSKFALIALFAGLGVLLVGFRRQQ